MYAWQFAKALYCGSAWLDAFRFNAAPLQPDLPGRGTGNASALPGPEGRRDPLVTACQRETDPQTFERTQ